MNKLKNILNLSKIFIKENDKGIFNFIDIKNRTIDKKSKIFWALIVLFFAISYLSSEVVDYLKDIGKPELFINGYFLVLQVVLIIQSIILGINIFYFSKDNGNILYLPFKPFEIFIAKFNTLLYMLYVTELIFGLFPLFMYGNNMSKGIGYVFKLFLVLIIFPIFFALIVSMAIMLLMNLIKFLKNKNLIQFIICGFLMMILFLFLTLGIKYIFNNGANNLDDVVQKLKNINKCFLINNFSINILIKNNIFINLIYLIFSNFFAFLLFVLLGNKLYLNQLLKTMNYYKNKINKEFNLNKKIRKNSVIKSYIKKDFILLTRNPLFFMQCVYPVIMMTVSVCILLFIIISNVNALLEIEEYKSIFQNLHFDIEAVCIILGLTQFVTLFNYCSVTAFSREGNDIYANKFLPISFYKQFLYKNVPQVVINILCVIPILLILKLTISAIEVKYILMIFVLAILMILINSFILCLTDLLNPKISWKAEYEILKSNKNKLLQYVLIVFNILFLIGMKKIFKNYNLNISLIIIFILLILIFIGLNVFTNKQRNKLFKNIK